MTLVSLALMNGLAISLEAMVLAIVFGSFCLILIVTKSRMAIPKVVLIVAMIGFGLLWAAWMIDWQAPKLLEKDSIKLDVIGQIQGLVDDDGKSARLVLKGIDPPGHKFKLHWRSLQAMASIYKG